jgi:hypothetical protein
MTIDTTAAFIEWDYRRWIFPLRSPVVFAHAGTATLRKHINSSILDTTKHEAFLAGQLAYSRKDRHHLRRVLVLDPISTFFLYDFVSKHQDAFVTNDTPDRSVYGHTFRNAGPVDAFQEYHSYRRKKYQLIVQHGHFAQADVFNCFNSFYHHDVTTFVIKRTSSEAGRAFGQFLRELNAGVSVACFPQGMYPAKAVGHAYLSLIETSRQLRTKGFARFLDDIVMADSSRAAVETHLLDLQYLLDKHHLTLNDSKTLVGEKGQRFRERGLDRIKKGLVAKRELTKSLYDEWGGDAPALTEKEQTYLTELVQRPGVAQEDIELALTLLREESDAVPTLITLVLREAPHLLRNLHRFLEFGLDHEAHLLGLMEDALKEQGSMAEHDLFWYARILIDYLPLNQRVADLLVGLYEHADASPVVKAAILETASLDHGFAELKEEVVRSEGTLLLAAAAMVGMTGQERGKRNHVFKYAARHSAHSALLVEIAGQL